MIDDLHKKTAGQLAEALNRAYARGAQSGGKISTRERGRLKRLVAELRQLADEYEPITKRTHAIMREAADIIERQLEG